MIAAGIGLGALMALLQLYLTRRMAGAGRLAGPLAALKLAVWVAGMLLMARVSIPALIAMTLTATGLYVGYVIYRHARS